MYQREALAAWGSVTAPEMAPRRHQRRPGGVPRRGTRGEAAASARAAANQRAEAERSIGRDAAPAGARSPSLSRSQERKAKERKEQKDVGYATVLSIETLLDKTGKKVMGCEGTCVPGEGMELKRS